MRAILASAVLAGIALSAVPAVAQDPVPPIPPLPVTGNQIMDGTWDGAPQRNRGGLPAQWLGVQVKPLKKVCFSLTCANYALKLAKTPVRDGTRAARFEVRDGDIPFGDVERSQVQGPATGKAGSLRWYTWSMYLPANFKVSAGNDARFVRLTTWAVPKGVPPLGIYVDRGQLTLQVNASKGPNSFRKAFRPWGVPAAPLRNRWVDFGMFVKWSASGDGQVQLFVDGVQQKMNWPFGGEGEDPAAHGGVGAYAYSGQTLVPRGGATYIQQGISRAKKVSGKMVVTLDAMKVFATTTPLPVPPATP